MKKEFIMLGIALLACATVKSQTLTVGPKVGINISNLTNLEDLEAKTGLTAGGFLVYSFIENFGVGVDALYSREGAKYVYRFVDGDDVTSYKYRVNLNYLRFNVPLNYFFRTQEDGFRPKVFLGPSFGFLLGAKSESEFMSSTSSEVAIVEGTTTVTDSYKGFDFGALAGAGFNLRIAEATWFNFDASWKMGATHVLKNSTADPVKNTGFGLTAGVGFGF